MAAPWVFVNREDELAALEEWWDQSYPRPGLIWGRRRVGKTELIKNFAREKRLVFYTGAGSVRAVELAQFSREVASVVPDRYRDLEQNPYRDWFDAFEHLSAAAGDEPLLVVLDEFPELLAGAPDLPGVLRAVLDRVHGHTKLRLLLSGSSVRAMWAMQEYRAPLYGRFDLTLDLHPFRPHEAALMLPDLTPTDRALVYGIVGGVPLYLAMWDQSTSVEENLGRLVIRQEGALYNEGRLIMATEVGTGRQGDAVLSAIASGRTRFHEISDVIGTDPTRSLERLVELRLVERMLPVTDDAAKTRRKIYRIVDNFLRFYLSIVMRNRSKVELGLTDTVLPVVMSSLDDHMGEAYEDAFRDYLRRYAATIDPQAVAVGPWWRSDGQNQIDAVVLAGRGRRPVLVGEAKWAKSVSAARVKAGLIRKAEGLVDDPTGLSYALCARERVENPDDTTWAVTAADIFG